MGSPADVGEPIRLSFCLRYSTQLPFEAMTFW